MPQTGDLARRLAVARGDEPADLVVRGGRVLSVFTREWLDVDVAICDGVIAGLGSYDGAETLDADGAYVVPGFIDAHLHLETSKLLPSEFARLVLPLGTTAVVADPHEIANVLGTDGVHWLVDVCEDLPLDVFFTASSCVPASGFESPRRPFTPGDLESLLRRKRVIGLAEMMNFPGVISGAPSELAKLAVDGARPRRRTCAGSARARAPGLRRSRNRLRPRGVHGRGRAGAPAGRDVAPDPGGVRRAEPARARAARRRVRPVANGVLHRRPRAGAHRRGRSHQRDGARRGLVRRLGRGRARHGVASSGSLARARRPRRDRARLPGRPAAAARPRAVRARDRAQARPGGPGDHADGGAGVGDAERADPAGRGRGLPGARGRAVAPG